MQIQVARFAMIKCFTAASFRPQAAVESQVFDGHGFRLFSAFLKN
jgi:hypothetical protein